MVTNTVGKTNHHHTPDTMATIQRYVGLFDSDEQEMVRERLGDCLQSIVSLRLLIGKDGRGRIPALLREAPAPRESSREGTLGVRPRLPSPAPRLPRLAEPLRMRLAS